MKTLLMSLTLFAGLFFVSCSDDDDPDPEIIDSSMPMGSFTASATGDIVAESDTPTSGTVELGTDEEGTQFLHFDSDFTTNLGTGTLTVFLSTSETYMADPMAGNPDLKLIGVVNSTGEQYFKIDPTAESKFTHVIIWCASAGISFGYAEL